jgi:hypothetical protein
MIGTTRHKSKILAAHRYIFLSMLLLSKYPVQFRKNRMLMTKAGLIILFRPGPGRFR